MAKSKVILFSLCAIVAYVAGQRITTIQLDGVQYFISRMNPYSPELNYFLAYQYCRSLGLQLASFETKEKVESMTTYLQNAGYSKYDFWTSGNRLGTGMFLWMSTGLPFNATFDYFGNSVDPIQAGILDPVDHNSNTAPQRTARDSNSGLDKGCVLLKAPALRWTPEDCSTVKDFICEQTRCYYYNYGSIPVSSAQGRPITSTTIQQLLTSTTAAPSIFPSTYSALARKSADQFNGILEPPLNLLNRDYTETNKEEEKSDQSSEEDNSQLILSFQNEAAEDSDEEANKSHEEIRRSLHASGAKSTRLKSSKRDHNSEEIKEIDSLPIVKQEPSVEHRIKQLTQEIEKLNSSESNESDIGHSNFPSLSNLMKTLRPIEEKIPQIDSDYSNTMRVLSETPSLVSSFDKRLL